MDERKQLENAVERHLTKRVKQARGRCIKQYMRGWPDRLCVLPGRIFFVETKRPKGGRYQPLQLYMHRMIRRMGHAVYLCKTKGEVDEIFE